MLRPRKTSNGGGIRCIKDEEIMLGVQVAEEDTLPKLFL